MKNELKKRSEGDFANKKITRKEAIKKTGLMAASTATMMILLNSQKAQAGSPHCRTRTKSGNKNHHHHHHHQNGGGKKGPWGKSNGGRGGRGGGQGRP